jgi:YVTN family beta-propeller protein
VAVRSIVYYEGHVRQHASGVENTTMANDVLAVANQGGEAVAFFDTKDYRCLDVVAVAAQPHELCFDAVRRLLYCTHTYRSGDYDNHGERAREVSVIDPDDRQVVDVIDLAPESAPHGIALDAARDLLYVSVEASGTAQGGLVVLDLVTRRPVDRITTGAKGPHWFAVTPDGRKAYVTNMEAPFVSVVDLLRRDWVGRVDVTGSGGVGVAPDGEHAYIATPHPYARGADLRTGIQVVETGSDRIVHTIPTRHKAVAVHVTVTGTLLVSEVRFGERGPDNGWLNVFAPDTVEPLGRFDIGKLALSIGSSPDGGIGYVASTASNTVDVVDLTTMAPITRISTRARPHGLVHVPAA